MTVDKAVMIWAGSLILLSLLLSQIFSPLWLIFTAAIGVMLIQTPITGFCPAAYIFKKLGLKTDCCK